MFKIKLTEGKRYTFKTHINDVLLPREKSKAMEAFLVIIEPGKYTHPHKHAENEQLYHVVSGRGLARFTRADGTAEEVTLEPQDVLHIPHDTMHQIFCTSDEPLRYLCVDGFVGGMPTDEPTWDIHAQAIYALQRKLE